MQKFDFFRKNPIFFFKGTFKLHQKDPKYFNDFNSKMQKIMESNGNQRKISFERFLVPGAMIFGSLLVFQGWKWFSYGKMFEHFTISEYVNQKNHYHAIFLSGLSFQTTGHFLTYFPLMAYSLFLNASYLSPGGFLIFYGLNSLLSTAMVYGYEKYYKNQKMIVPKCLGACTSLSNLFYYLVMNPQHLILGNRMFPYFILPIIIGMYEINEFSAGYVNEISRPAHLTSIGFGIIFGIIGRKFLIK